MIECNYPKGVCLATMCPFAHIVDQVRSRPDVPQWSKSTDEHFDCMDAQRQVADKIIGINVRKSKKRKVMDRWREEKAVRERNLMNYNNWKEKPVPKPPKPPPLPKPPPGVKGRRNRVGASGFKGVYANGNSWVVRIDGIHYARYKDKQDAVELAERILSGEEVDRKTLKKQPRKLKHPRQMTLF